LNDIKDKSLSYIKMENVIVKSRIKEVAQGCNVSSDFSEKLNEVAQELISKASARCKANNRKTVSAKDVYCGKISAKVLLVSKSKVKESTPDDCNTASTFVEALNQALTNEVDQAVLRCKENNRKTISPKDL